MDEINSINKMNKGQLLCTYSSTSATHEMTGLGVVHVNKFLHVLFIHYVLISNLCFFFHMAVS